MGDQAQCGAILTDAVDKLIGEKEGRLSEGRQVLAGVLDGRGALDVL